VTFWCGSGSGSPDPYLWLMYPDPGPTPDPTPFFNDFKDVKKIIFIFFSFPQSLLKLCVKMLFCQALFQSTEHIYGKREGSGAGADPDPCF
jgi:hypothetical protein